MAMLQTVSLGLFEIYSKETVLNTCISIVELLAARIYKERQTVDEGTRGPYSQIIINRVLIRNLTTSFQTIQRVDNPGVAGL